MKGLSINDELDRVVPRLRKLIALSPIKEELIKLSQTGNSKTRMQAKIGLKFIEKYANTQEVTYFHKNIDFILLDYAEKQKGIIATNDRKLRKFAGKKGIKTLYIRNRQFLELK